MIVKRIVYISSLLVILWSCKKEPIAGKTGNFTLEVRVDEVADNTKVLLKKQENNTTITIDSTMSKNGSFVFSGNIDIPTIYGIFIDSINGGIFPLVERGTIKIVAHKDSLYAAKISGSKLNDELNQFRENSKNITSKINDLFPLVQKARSENDSKKLEELNEKMRAVNDENTQFSLKYAKENPESYIAAMVLQSLLRMPTLSKDSIAEIYHNFSDEVKQSEHSKTIARFLNSPTVKKDSIRQE